jgi:type I restriction enzyme M protein
MGADFATNDPYSRFHRGLPPASKGDSAFISHMVEIAQEGEAAWGSLFRTRALSARCRRHIRKQIIDENILEADIGLPRSLFLAPHPLPLFWYSTSKETLGRGSNRSR